MLGATCPRFLFFLNHKKSRRNREGHHDDECGKRVGVSVLIKKTRKTPGQKEKGKKVAIFCQGISHKHPGILGQFPYPSCTTFLSLETHSITHCPLPPPLPHFLTHLQLQQQQY
jgi:hypothetical protein